MKTLRPFHSSVALALFSFILAACRSVGPPLQTEARPEPEAVIVPPSTLPPPWPTPSPPAVGHRQLYVTTLPDEAQVFIDGRFYGMTPLLLPDFAIGHYYLEIVKDGYKRYDTWVDYSDDQWAFFYTLVRETGFIDVRVSPPDAKVRTTSFVLRPGLNELPAGAHTVTASTFGYTAKAAAVSIRTGETSIVTITLDKAAFGFSGLSVSRTEINPRRPGPASSVTMLFSVSGPGSGGLSVIGADGRELAHLDVVTFSSRYQSVRWNGRTDSGGVAPDGTYALVIRGRGEGSPLPVEAGLEVAVDSSLSVEHGSLWSGSAGLAYAPTPLVLPAWDLELDMSALAGFAGQSGLSAPAALGARIGLGAGQEAALGLAALFGASDEPALIPSLSWKCGLISTPEDVSFSAALQAKAAYRINYNADFFTNPTGISVGVPLRLALGPFALYLAPELTAALYKVSSDPAAVLAPGAYVWLYGRAGLGLTLDSFTIAASAGFRTVPFDEGFALAYPVETAVEIAFAFPDTPLSLSAKVVAEWDTDAMRFWGGFGFGLLW
ncbi:MAG: PEGA domain-containing protein [Spirochaetales bacterium]|nr:PEGA domain-containing protein [Spirochaetales bacterium]